MKRQHKKTIIITVVVLLSTVLVFASDKIKSLVNATTKTPAKRIYDTLLSRGITPTLALLIVAQTKHETANYTSNVYKKNNNVGGYKYVKGNMYQIAPSIVSPEGNSYAKYASIEDSSKDLAAWYNKRMATFKEIKAGDLQAYANALKTLGYYTNPISEYLTGLKRFYTNTIA